METERGGAPSPTAPDIQYEKLFVYLVEEMGIAAPEARLLALYQFTGGNMFLCKNLSGEITYAPRPEA